MTMLGLRIDHFYQLGDGRMAVSERATDDRA